MLNERYVRNYGLRVGRVFGIEIWFHWAFIIIAGLELIWNLLRSRELGYAHPIGYWAVFVLALTLTLLLHEFGHCYAAFRRGGRSERIVLWPLGGLAYADAPHHPTAQFWVAAGGPLVNVALALVSALVCVAAGWYLLPFSEPVAAGFSFGKLLVQYLFLWNVFLLVLNLLPCYPLDGGRMLQAVLWGRFQSYGEGSILTLQVSRVTAILGVVAGAAIIIWGFTSKTFSIDHPLLNCLGWGLILMALLYFYEARALRMRLEYSEEEEEGIFGYDFSRGYTSLERSHYPQERPSYMSRLRERSRQRARARKLHRERQMRERLDHLLEKIHREGIEKLSREERRFLARASKYFQSEASRDARR